MQRVLQRVQGFFGEESKGVAWGKKTTNMEGSTTPTVYALFVVGMAVTTGQVAFVRYVVSVVVTTGRTANAPSVGSEKGNMPRLVNAQPAESAVNTPAVCTAVHVLRSFCMAHIDRHVESRRQITKVNSGLRSFALCGPSLFLRC
jgi:hypothetical protein